VRETRERQLALWKEFVLDYCKANKARNGAPRLRTTAASTLTAPARRWLRAGVRRRRRRGLAAVQQPGNTTCAALASLKHVSADLALTRRLATRQAARRRTTKSAGRARR
jgi:hypothetical protein